MTTKRQREAVKKAEELLKEEREDPMNGTRVTFADGCLEINGFVFSTNIEELIANFGFPFQYTKGGLCFKVK